MSYDAKLSISITTGLALVYVVVASISTSFPLAFALFLFTLGSLVWMVYCILKDDTHQVSKTFDDLFYLDREISRKQLRQRQNYGHYNSPKNQ